MTNEELLSHYLLKIDPTKLQRDYIKYPLLKKGKFREKPYRNDLIYLYHTLNFPTEILHLYLKCDEQRHLCWFKQLNIPRKSKENIELSRRELSFIKTGFPSSNQNSEVKKKKEQTCLKRYGVSNPFQSKDIQRKCRDKEKKKYGVIAPSQIPTAKEKKKQKLPESLRKSYHTKKTNHTFNSSKPEESIYNILKERFPDCIHTYREERYPFNCDFYIPSLDLFIELNFHWTHGFHPYNPDDPKDLEVVASWKAKSTEVNFKNSTKKYYEIALETWTVRDTCKRKLARKNNLNYLEFFNKNEFLDWFDNFDEEF